MNRDLHIVIEARRDFNGGWKYRALTPAIGWHEAIDIWTKLDDERRGGIFPRSMSEHYYAVRSDTDPNWAWLTRPKLRKSKYHSKRIAAKEYGAAQGVFGDSGGWLRRRGQEEYSITQGWDSYAIIIERNGRIRKDAETGFWYASGAQPLLRAPLPGMVAA